MYKILGTDNKEYGPVPADQVRQWITERRLHAQSLVLAEGTTSWKPLSLFPEFSATLASAPLPPGGSVAPRPGYVPSAGNNQMAVWSLVCGCVGVLCCQPVSVAALIMGIVALGQLKANPQEEGRGMAIAGIVLGCLGLVGGIVLLLVMVLGSGFDAFTR